MSSYNVLSAYYDRLMTEFPYDKYAEYVLGFVSSGKGHDLPPLLTQAKKRRRKHHSPAPPYFSG